MTITVKLHDGTEKEINIKGEQILLAVTGAGVFGFVKREVNRVRPPKRNIGLILNHLTAVAVTDAIIRVVFAKDVTKTIEPEVVEEAEYSEVKEACDGTK